jgi:hypothetical protein
MRLLLLLICCCRAPFTAASLVEQLADSFTGFQDEALYTTTAAAGPAADPAAAASDSSTGTTEQQQQHHQGEAAIRVLFLRKAQALAADLAARFGAHDERFRWSDAADLSADSGGV